MSLFTKTVTLGLISVLTMGGVQAQNLVANGSFENWTYTPGMSPIPFPMPAGHVPPWTYSLGPVSAQFHRQSASGLHRENGIHLTGGAWIQQMITSPATHQLVVLFNSSGTRGATPRQATIQTSFGASVPQTSTMATPTLTGPQKHWASTTLAHVFPAPGGSPTALNVSTGDVTGVSLDDVYAIATTHSPATPPGGLLGAAVGNELNSTNAGPPVLGLTALLADLRVIDTRAVTISCDPLLQARLFVVGRHVGAGPITFKWSASNAPVAGVFPGKVYQRVHLYNWTKKTWWDFDSVPPKPLGYGVSLLQNSFQAPIQKTPPALASNPAFISPPGTGNLVIARISWSYAPPVPPRFPSPPASGPFFRVAVDFASF